MKRGLTHIDWAISIGLFLIYLIVVIVLFRPGIAEDYTADFLSSIIKQGIEENSSIIIEKMPIFIEPLGSVPAGDYSITLPEVDFWELGNSAVVNENLEMKDFNYAGSSLTFEGYLEPSKKTTFWILKSDSILYTSPEAISEPLIDPLDFTYALGVKQKIKGIYRTKFDTDINQTDYSALKEQWHYPAKKDFEIFIYNGLNLTNPEFEITNGVETNNEQINVLQWSDWFINENSSREVITIMVRTW